MAIEWCRRLALATLALWCSLPVGAQAQEARAQADLLQGQRIYREGILPSGQPLTGMAQSGVVRTGKDAACLACHRRSGFGTAEGAFVIPPITAPDLHPAPAAGATSARDAYWQRRPQRPAYDDAALARAIREGIAPTGRQLQSAMPRYGLGDSDMAALQAYLKTLFIQDGAGVTPAEIHLATVIQPDVPQAKRRAMLDVLEAFVRDKNAGVRSEEARRSAGTMRMHRAYRKWVLHVWELSGPPPGWDAQLEEAYRRQPVFALVAGLGAAAWEPIHAFSERLGLPCVLPLTDLPATRADNFYTVYFSRGLALEADALARFVGQDNAAGRVIQAYRPGSAGAEAAQAFRAALAGADRRLEDRLLTGDAGEGFWRELAGTPAAALVLWLGPDDLARAGLLGEAGAPARAVYLSSTLLDGQVKLPGIQALLTYPWDLPATREPRVLRSTLWLRTHGVRPAQEELQSVAVNTLFAITVAGDALSHIQDSFSREYFVERVEHNITTTLTPTFYPNVSLGPGKRFASKGAYIVRPQAAANGALAAVSDWIVP